MFINGKVICARRDLFTVRGENEMEYEAKLSGRMRTGDPLCVGDFVTLLVDDFGSAVITERKERITVFARPNRGGHGDGFVKTMQEEVLVANVDYCFIVTSVNDDFSPNRIARYAAVAVAGGIVPVAILTKADLTENLESYLEKVSALNKDLQVLAVSSYTGFGLDILKERFMQPGKTIALLGSSGAGKSTLVNTLAGAEVMKVSAIREEDSKGRHTTTHREIVTVSGVDFVDTPGLRELGLCDVEEAIDQNFDDIAELITQCRFSDCRHETEPGCAVKAALLDGTLSSERWETYRCMVMESRWAKKMKVQIEKNIAKNRKELNHGGRKNRF